MAKIRLFIEEKNLSVGAKIKISDADFEYLTKVMRQKIGDKIFLFNGLDGEFEAKIEQIEKKFLSAEIESKISDLKKVVFSDIFDQKLELIIQVLNDLLPNQEI